MLAHPRCSCTRASLNELAILMTRAAGRLSATVIFVRPDGTPPGWDDTDLRRTAAAIPGVHVLTDSAGLEASRFGAWTSGQVCYYDAAGRLAFSGGITAGRGHEGDNAGRSSLEARLAGYDSGPRHTAVFGCSLFGPRDRKVRQ
jgi:hypothetical protein